MRLEITDTAPDPKNTAALRGSKLYARSNGSFAESMISAGYYAKKHGTPMHVYPGNSYMVAVWRVSYKQSDALSLIGNTGPLFYTVTPDLEVLRVSVKRPNVPFPGEQE